MIKFDSRKIYVYIFSAVFLEKDDVCTTIFLKYT